jgi:hypothetical protein
LDNPQGQLSTWSVSHGSESAVPSVADVSPDVSSLVAEITKPLR